MSNKTAKSEISLITNDDVPDSSAQSEQSESEQARVAQQSSQPEPDTDDQVNADDGGTSSSDSGDIRDLIEEQDDDDITEEIATKVVLGKPRGFFMVCPLPEYRKRMGIYVHKVEGKPGETFYGVTKKMRAEIEEAHPCTVVTYVNRLLVPGLWAIKLPDEDGNDHDSWKQQRQIAKKAMKWWTRFVRWTGTTYITRPAREGYAPVPMDWKKILPPYEKLLTRGFGKKGIIRNYDHFIYKELYGLSQPTDDVDDDDDDL